MSRTADVGDGESSHQPAHPPDALYTIPYRVGLLETALLNESAERKSSDAELDRRVDQMEGRWNKLDGAFSLVKFALGTSVVSMILALAALWSLLQEALS